MSAADAVDREIAWYLADVPGLPPLHKDAGGPWDTIQAYQRKEPGRKRALHLVRTEMLEQRNAMQRGMSTHIFVAHLRWPVDSTAGRAEADQRALDVAIDAVIVRIRGLLGDKTHGNRFLSVAENPAQVSVEWDDALVALRAGEPLVARISYRADDPETAG